MYKVICRFADLQDGNHIYEVGDIFPHDGKEVTEDRIMELASDKNKIGVPLIKAVIERPKSVESDPGKPKKSKKKG